MTNVLLVGALVFIHVFIKVVEHSDFETTETEA